MRNEDYSLIRELSRGGTGVTSIILRQGSKRISKQTLYHSDAGLRQVAAQRLRNEARVLSQMEGANSPRLLRYAETDGLPNIEMEFCEGGSLDRQFSLMAFAPHQAELLATHLLQALHRLHRLGYVHRDVKPANILTRRNGDFLLADFELSTPLPRWRENREQAGTLLYCSPEQLGLLSKELSYNSDLFSLGIVLFQAVSNGRHPFSDGQDAHYLQKLRDAQAPAVPSSVSPPIAKLIAALLEKDPSSRIATCEEAAALLGASLAPAPVTGEATTEDVCKRYFGPAEIDASLVLQVEGLTDRSILGASELLDQFLAKGMLRFEENRWSLPATVLAAMADRPEFRTFAQRRKAALNTMQVEGWAKLAEVPFPFSVEFTASVLDMPASSAEALLAAGAQEGVLTQQGSQYSFSNEILRKAIAAELKDSHRGVISERTLEFAHHLQVPVNLLADLAHSIEPGSRVSSLAFQVLEELGLQCARSGQSNEAVHHLAAAQRLEPSRFGKSSTLVKNLADMLQLVGQAEEAEKLYLELYQTLPDVEDKARAMTWASRTAVRRLEWSLASSYVDQGLDLIRSGGGSLALLKEALRFVISRFRKPKASSTAELELELANIRGYLAYFQMDQAKLISSLLRAAPLVEIVPDSYEALNGWLNLSALWSAMGWKKESLRCISRAREMSLALNTPRSILGREYFDGNSADEKGDFKYSREIFLKRGEEMINHLAQNERAMVAGIRMFHMLLTGNVQKAGETVQLFEQKQAEDHLPPCIEFLPFKLCWQTMAGLPTRETRKETLALLDKAPKYRRITTNGLLIWSEAMTGSYDLARCDKFLSELQGVFPYSIYFGSGALGCCLAYLLAYEAHAVEAGRCEKALAFFMKKSLAPELRMFAHLLKGRFHWLKGEKQESVSEIAKAEMLYFGNDFPLFEAELAWTRFLMAKTGLEDPKALSRLAFSNMSAARYAGLAFIAQRYQPYVSETNLGDKSIFAPGRAKTVFGANLVTPTAFESAESELLRLQLNALKNLSASVATEFDPRRHAQLVLQETLKAIGGERAFIFQISDADEIQLFAGRDKEGNEIAATGISESLVKRVRLTRIPQTLSVSNGREVEFSQSIQENSIRSVVCAPLLLREKLLGILYVDSRITAGVYDDSSVQLLESIASQMAISMETTRAARLEKENAALEKDLQVTGAVQKLLLPRNASQGSQEYLVCGQSNPAVQSGGDWWWYQARPDGKLWITLGDVTGHGAGSAMVASLLTGAFHAHSERASTPEEVLNCLHRIIRQSCGSSFSATFAFLELDSTGNTLKWWNCAGPPVFLVNEDGVQPLAQPGNPLGSEQFVLPQPVVVPMPRGSRLLLFSDGLTEAQINGRPLGMLRLKKKISELRRADGDQLITELASLVVQPGQALEDDVTLVMLERRSAQPPALKVPPSPALA